MQQTVCFYNDGAFDKRAFTMLGLSAKQDNAIGFFGTGFKYAIATLVRNGAHVRVYVRNHDDAGSYTLYSFGMYKGEFRNKPIDLISCLKIDTSDDTSQEFELPFTAHLGVNWKLWQAYRELFTNAKDEGGNVTLCDDSNISTIRGLGDVVVYVTGCDEFTNVYHNRDKLFIDVPTLAQSYCLRVINKIANGENSVYYKSMYTGTKLDKPTYFSYDYTAGALTEDRTLADTWYIRGHIAEVWCENMSYDMLIEHLPRIAKDEYYEYGLTYNYSNASDDFVRACSHLVEHHRPLPMWARDIYVKTLPFDDQVAKFKLNKLYKQQLAKAIKIMDCCDMQVDETIIHCVVSLPENLCGMVKDNNIYIAKTAFERGFQCLLGTLYEEWLHYTTSCEDTTRRMQNLIIDRVAVLMERVYELEAS